MSNTQRINHPLYALFPEFAAWGIDFDRTWEALQRRHAGLGQSNTGFPPHNITRSVDDDGTERYEIAIAVAGFTRNDLTVTSTPDSLVIEGRRPDSNDDPAVYLHRGIAGRAFTRKFALPEHVKVTGATLADGMLRIALAMELPEEVRPKEITIG
jgi:molecular chaperone IbpA